MSVNNLVVLINTMHSNQLSEYRAIPTKVHMRARCFEMSYMYAMCLLRKVSMTRK